MVQLSHPYMTTQKTIAVIVWTFVGKVMSLLFNVLSRFATAFLPRKKTFSQQRWPSQNLVWRVPIQKCVGENTQSSVVIGTGGMAWDYDSGDGIFSYKRTNEVNDYIKEMVAKFLLCYRMELHIWKGKNLK